MTRKSKFALKKNDPALAAMIFDQLQNLDNGVLEIEVHRSKILHIKTSRSLTQIPEPQIITIHETIQGIPALTAQPQRELNRQPALSPH